MWEDYDSYFVREDALKKLKSSVTDVAKTCNIELRLLGGLLKFTPNGVYSKVLLELEQPNFKNNAVIYKHRNSQLTSEHKGKAVSEKWVIGFLKHNAEEAKRLIDEKQQNDKDSEKSKADKQSTKPRPAQPQSNEESNYGYGLGKSICPVCNGDGGAAGQCYKCGGTGWA